MYDILQSVMPDVDNDEYRTEEELVAEFKSAAQEAIEESDYATREEVMDFIEKKVDEHGDERVDEEQREADQVERLPNKLEAHGVPQELIEAIKEHLDVGRVSKELGVDHVDPYLARQLESGGEILSAQREKAQARQDAVAEQVAEGATTDSILDHTVYDGEEDT